MRLAEIGREVLKVQDGGSIVIVSDENIAPLYLDKCKESLEASGFKVYTYVVEPGENSKSGETYLEILNFLADIPLTRTDGIVALGGGIVGDLAGFVAATYLRGIKVVQVPTTLLAAVDSSVGGKTAINLKAGKNLAGAFHQPIIVFQDVELLKTIPENTFRDGMAEVIKYGCIADAELFENLKDPAYVKENLESIVHRCVAIKRKYVEEDEFDMGVRHMLNFGHTIAHAIEKLSGYETSHGSAVAIGMDMISKISVKQGWCDTATAEAIHDILVKYGFDLEVKYLNDEIYEIMKSDKKRESRHIDIIIPRSIGVCEMKRLSIKELREIL